MTLDGRHVVMPVASESESEDGDVNVFVLSGQICGSTDPVLRVTMTDDDILYDLRDALTGVSLGELSGVGIATVPPERQPQQQPPPNS